MATLDAITGQYTDNTASLGADNATITIETVGSAATWTAQITGTFSGTLTFYGSTDKGVTYNAIADTAGATTTTTTGVHRGDCTGYTNIQIKMHPYVSGTATVQLTSSTAQLAKNLVINVKDYGAVGDGSNDDTAAITVAMSAANSAGGGIVYSPHGTYITGNQTLYSNVRIIGAGAGVTTWKLKNGSNTDLLSAQTNLINLSALAQSSGNGTLSNFSIESMTLDGNQANQTGTSYTLRFYGYRFTLRDLEIINGYSDGILCDWNGTASDMEARIDNVRIHNCNGAGLRMGGPHDSRIDNVLSHSNGSHGFHFGPNAGGTLCKNIHPYSLTQSVSAVGCLCEASSMSYVDCMFEGSDFVQFAAIAANISINGGMIFGNTGYAGVGLQLGQVGSATPIPGQINQSAGATTSVGASICNINTLFLNCTNGVINFRNEFRNNIIANVYQTSGTFLVSNHYPDGSDQLFINISGLANDHTWNTQGGIQIASSNSQAFLFGNASGTSIFDLDGNGKVFSLVNGGQFYGYSDNFTTPKFFLDGAGGTLRLNNASTFFSGSGAPSNSNGSNGDFYFRSDTPGTTNQRIYVKSAGSWVGIV